MTDPIRRTAVPLACLLLWLCLAVALQSPGRARDRNPSWLQQLRALFGSHPYVAPGGSRGAPTPAWICLITPRVQEHQGPPTALVTLPSPTILSQQPLAEWRLEDSAGRTLAGALARSDRPLQGPIAWPLPPLQPGEMLTLRLRSLDASGSDYVTVRLQAASAADQALALQRLNDRRDRLQMVQELLRQGKRSEAMELLWASVPAPTPALIELRRMVQSSHCAPRQVAQT